MLEFHRWLEVLLFLQMFQCRYNNKGITAQKTVEIFTK